MECSKCHFDNPRETSFCGKCGTKLGSIPQASVTRTIETAAEELSRGVVFAGRYEIIEELGTGGMGRVYRAFDRKIDEEVALKLIKPEIAAERKTVERFRNELRIARKVSHPNVCRMHDLNEEGKTLYITMEYVTGEDLRSVIRRMEKLTTSKALSVARQIAEGLGQAHKLGVVHRDLKPHNIMIDRAGNAKIMDFGIARSLEAKGLTGEGAVVGTPEYMSPEQVDGKPADARSDIYALGVILFEMVTGHTPFEGETPMSIAHKHKYEPAPDPKKLNTQIPAALSKIILRSLEKSKEKRYQTTDELVADLAAVEAGLPTAERLTTKRRPITSREITVKLTPKKLLIPASGIALLAVLAGVWFAVLKKQGAILSEEKRAIAIISFQNQTGDQSYDYLSKVIPNLLITKLEQSGHFNVTTWERLRDLLKQVGKGDTDFIDADLGFEICQKEGVENIVLGMVSKSGNTFVTDAKVLQVGTKKLLSTASSQGDGPDSILKTQVDDLGRQVARGVGLSEGKFGAAAGRIADMTTGSLEAYNYYIKAQEEWDKLNMAQASQYLEKAVALDPNFAIAWARLGGESLKTAMALSKNVTEKERLYIEASYVYEIEKNSQRALSIWRQIINKYPKEKMAYDYLIRHVDNPREVIEMCSKAQELDPGFGMAGSLIGSAFLQLRQPEQAIEAIRKYVEARPGEANPLDCLGSAYFIQGRLDEALETYKKAVDIDRTFSNSILAIGYIYALRYDYSEAFKWVEEAIRVTLGTEKPYPYLCKAFYLAWLGSHERALSNIQVAADLSQALNYNWGRGMAEWLKAWVYYDRGDLELSRKCNESSLAFLIGRYGAFWDSYDRVGYKYLGGLADLREGQIESAKSKLAEMESLTAGVQSLAFMRDMTDFETEWLRSLILLQEKPVEKTAVSFQKAAIPEFSPEWVSIMQSSIRYNTPFQRDALAKAWVSGGQVNKAIVEYERLITFDPTKPARLLVHPLYHYRLGLLYEKKGLRNEAKLQFDRFLDLWKDADPGKPEVDDAKKRLAGLRAT